MISLLSCILSGALVYSHLHRRLGYVVSRVTFLICYSYMTYSSCVLTRRDITTTTRLMRYSHVILQKHPSYHQYNLPVLFMHGITVNNVTTSVAILSKHRRHEREKNHYLHLSTSSPFHRLYISYVSYFRSDSGVYQKKIIKG